MHKMKGLLAVALVAAFAATGCARYRTYWFKSYEGKIDMAKDKILVMPIALHGYPSDIGLAMQAAIVAGFAAQFGANAISLQPAMPIMKTMGLDRFTYWLSWSIYLHLHWYGARYNGYLTRGARGKIVQLIPLLGTFANKAVEILQALKVPIPEGYKFTYGLAADMMNYGTAWGGKARKIRYVGGIVDIPQKRIVCGTFMVKTIMNNKVALVAAAATVAKTLKKQFKAVFAGAKKG